MSILCLGRSIKINYAKWLKDAGQELWLLTSVPQFPLQHDYRFVRQLDNFDSGEEVLSIATELAKHTVFTHILPHSEFDLVRAAQLREYLGIKGQSVKSAMAYRDKVLMKEYLEKADIEVAPFKRLNNWTDILLFCKKYPFPVVIKPVDGCSSKDILVAKELSELATFFQHKTVEGWMIEKFIDGEMYHVNGVITENGDAFFAPCAYINNALDFKIAGIFGSRTIEATTPLAKRLVELTKKTISALPATSVLGFHAEIFHTSQDKLILCEIASRTAGSLTGELIEKTWGINIHESWIKACAGNIKKLQYNSSPDVYAASIRMPVRTSTLLMLPVSVPFDWVSTMCISGTSGGKYNQATTYTDDVVSAVITGKDDKQLQEHITTFIKWLEHNVVWM
ncbi:acetyl-CoA carboxylase biotin carboxylase subunit family protein [Kosakonia sp. MUSA4]|uniref:ATP-grasp domain-containing protein n=1 Tax=Kosakonia sp. MUSA4 TaxID=2067958 RepID=UPI001598A87B|nr:ATP-grasp domain-containing protein [Kosakonia sp. MUSA4]QJT82554.1 hypothetical protein C0557_21985 [Kosakonia sp. MUSA4]